MAPKRLAAANVGWPGLVSHQLKEKLGNKAPFACHVMAKPSGPICNLSCEYCFYLEKQNLFPGIARGWRMDDETLELYVRQYLAAQDVPVVNFAWQGGEPTLMGIDFYRRALEYQSRYADGKKVTNALQTNGVLLDDDWCEFLAENDFLVGISIDGPRELHDQYRVDGGGNPSFDRVMAGLDALKRHRVEFNTLTVLNSTNSTHPGKVYRFLKDVGSHYMQFIPVVERTTEPGTDSWQSLAAPASPTEAVTDWSIRPAQYGAFLCAVFDQWVREDIGRYFVQAFDTTLASWMGQNPGLCIFSETCGDALIIEHNGDIYACDHFVYPDYRLGNVRESTIRELATSPKQIEFGQAKSEGLPSQCLSCDFRFACNGGCPKQRFTTSTAGESGLNYLCEGYKSFFSHSAPYMQIMAAELRQGRPPSNIIPMVLRQDAEAQRERNRLGRNDPCYCGSGKKYKRCCGA